MKRLLVALVLLIAVGAGSLIYLNRVRWNPETLVPKLQKSFLTALAAADQKTYTNLLSDAYSDQWGFDREQVLLAIRDVNRNFLSMHAIWTPEDTTITKKAATLTGTVRLDGEANPIGTMILSEANGIDAPFTFTWQREGAPWQWKLTKISHPNLDVPSGYTPGGLYGF